MKIIGYGSLIDSKNVSLVRVKRWKRIFNKTASRNVWKKHTKGKNIGVLNIIRSPSDSFNAVVYNINEKELKKLLERELDYQIEEVETFDYITGKNIGECLIFTTKDTIGVCNINFLVP